MSAGNKNAIDNVARMFADRDAERFVSAWLSSFYDSEGFHETLFLQTRIFCNFGGNRFFVEHKDVLYASCAQALMSYAEGVNLTRNQETQNAGVMSMMQPLEPIVVAARILALDSGSVRAKLVDMVNAIQPKQDAQ